MEDSRVKDVSSLLRAFFDEEQLRKGGQYADFFSSWKSIVGPREASHSRVAEIEKGILVIEAEHPGWIQLLQLRQGQILAAAQARFPQLELRGIAFKLQKDCMSVPVRQKEVQRPGPFGPHAVHVEDTEEEKSFAGDESLNETERGLEGSEADRGKGRRSSLDSIGDPELRERLLALKKAIDDDRKERKS